MLNDKMNENIIKLNAYKYILQNWSDRNFRPLIFLLIFRDNLNDSITIRSGAINYLNHRLFKIPELKANDLNLKKSSVLLPFT